jgi:DNA-binding MarR family transcriptional regulator
MGGCVLFEPMSATAEATDAAETAGPSGADLSEKQRRILQYLAENAEQTYFKSRLIADELGLSAKEVGANMRAIRREDVGLTVEKWGYSSGTTWMVTSDRT